MSNIINKIFSVVLVLIAFTFVAAGSAGAHDVNSAKATSNVTRLQHAFVPHRDTVTGQMIARVNNTSDWPFNGWVCATEQAAGKNWHIGCLKVDLGPRWSAIEFGVPTQRGGTVHYTYNTGDGVWRSVWPAVN